VTSGTASAPLASPVRPGCWLKAGVGFVRVLEEEMR
jgi:hypothetical protein